MDDKDFTIPAGVLSDLCSRFIINVPEEERTDLIRIFFQIEIAHWFYLDFYCDSSFSTISASSCNQLTRSPNFMTNCISPYNNTTDANNTSSSNDESNDNTQVVRQQQLMKPCSIRTFAENIFRHCPFLMQHTNQVDDILSKWKVFKHAVPTNGAIILDESMRNVLLVQGYWAKTSWGFPKGKVVEDESEAHCAQREVLEETGYDITDKLKDDQYLEIQINDQTIRLYIIPGVSKSENFEPRTRREIKDVRWFAIDELPVHRKDLRSKQTLGYSPNSFFMVIPFLKALKQWVFANNREVTYGQSGMQNSSSSGKLYRPQSTINHQRNIHSGHHHHHHHHHTHHNGNTSRVNTNQHNTSMKKSKSNEHLPALNNSGQKSKSNQKNLNKEHDNGQLRTQSIKQQSHHYQKMQQSEVAEFLSVKEAATKANNKQHGAVQQQPKTPKDNNNNSLSNMNQNHSNGKLNNQFGTHANSKFKPIHAENLNKNNKYKQTGNNNQQMLSSNITIVSASITNNKKQFQFNGNIVNQFATHNHKLIQHQQHQQQQALTNSLNAHIQHSMNSAKKHLEFSGPECWVNFKFDMNSIVQDLPQL